MHRQHIFGAVGRIDIELFGQVHVTDDLKVSFTNHLSHALRVKRPHVFRTAHSPPLIHRAVHRDFINEVVEQRLPNPFIPDMPQRIATDTSQKVPIRFGETIKSYMAHPEKDAAELKYIPLALAGWLRYLLAVDDKGEAFSCSSDPMLETLQNQLASVKLGDPDSATEAVLQPILSNPTLFGVSLYEAGLAEKVTDYLKWMLAGPGAVRATLEELV